MPGSPNGDVCAVVLLTAMLVPYKRHPAHPVRDRPLAMRFSSWGCVATHGIRQQDKEKGTKGEIICYAKFCSCPGHSSYLHHDTQCIMYVT